jgi:hypothetical protein
MIFLFANVINQHNASSSDCFLHFHFADVLHQALEQELAEFLARAAALGQPSAG